MKILKIIGLAVVAIIAIVFIGSFLVSTEMNYESTISIDAPIEVVWENVNSLADLDKWSPWNEKDPNMKVTRPVEDGIIGATQAWESDNPDVGDGSQTIAKMEAPNLLETDLKFYSPYESEAKAFVKLVKNGTSTEATWGFYSEMPRPWNLMMLGTDMEAMIGPDYRKGLESLKALSE